MNINSNLNIAHTPFELQLAFELIFLIRLQISFKKLLFFSFSLLWKNHKYFKILLFSHFYFHFLLIVAYIFWKLETKNQIHYKFSFVLTFIRQKKHLQLTLDFYFFIILVHNAMAYYPLSSDIFQGFPRKKIFIIMMRMMSGIVQSCCALSSFICKYFLTFLEKNSTVA